MTAAPELPRRVVEAEERAARAAFSGSCEPLVGKLLACLAASVPRRSRVLEIGTGMGVGLAWIVTGLCGRTDVEVVTVERDAECIEAVAAAQWPSWVHRVTGDVEVLLPALGRFALVLVQQNFELTQQKHEAGITVLMIEQQRHASSRRSCA